MPVNRRPSVDLERVIRPFVRPAPSVSRTRNFYSPNNTSSGTVVDTGGDDVPVLEWSAKAKVEVLTLPAVGFPVFINGPDGHDVQQDETNRRTHVERVTNPEDPEQYVDVEVIDDIDFKNSLGKTRKFRLNN